MAQAGRGREGMTWRFVCIGWAGFHDRFVMHMTKPRIRGLFLANSSGGLLVVCSNIHCDQPLYDRHPPFEKNSPLMCGLHMTRLATWKDGKA